jgi:hypothetical protein
MMSESPSRSARDGEFWFLADDTSADWKRAGQWLGQAGPVLLRMGRGIVEGRNTTMAVLVGWLGFGKE